MADHGLENRKEQELITRINAVDDSLKAIRSVQYLGYDSLKVETVSLYEPSPQLIPARTRFLAFATVETTNQQMLIPTLLWSVYQGNINPANELGKGTAFDENWFWKVWMSWEDSGPGIKAVLYIQIYNITFVDLTATYGWEMRYFINDATAS